MYQRDGLRRFLVGLVGLGLVGFDLVDLVELALVDLAVLRSGGVGGFDLVGAHGRLPIWYLIPLL